MLRIPLILESHVANSDGNRVKCFIMAGAQSKRSSPWSKRNDRARDPGSQQSQGRSLHWSSCQDLQTRHHEGNRPEPASDRVGSLRPRPLTHFRSHVATGTHTLVRSTTAQFLVANELPPRNPRVRR